LSIKFYTKIISHCFEEVSYTAIQLNDPLIKAVALPR